MEVRFLPHLLCMCAEKVDRARLGRVDRKVVGVQIPPHTMDVELMPERLKGLALKASVANLLSQVRILLGSVTTGVSYFDPDLVLLPCGKYAFRPKAKGAASLVNRFTTLPMQICPLDFPRPESFMVELLLYAETVLVRF